jgi:hypothetical protein
MRLTDMIAGHLIEPSGHDRLDYFEIRPMNHFIKEEGIQDGIHQVLLTDLFHGVPLNRPDPVVLKPELVCFQTELVSLFVIIVDDTLYLLKRDLQLYIYGLIRAIKAYS